MKSYFELLFLFYSRYKSSMRLNITKIRPQDYGEYHCVSKNEMGIARAVFHLQGNNFYLFEQLCQPGPTWPSKMIFKENAY